MITYHKIDSITLMSAIELIERNRWEQNRSQPETENVALILTALRNALKSPSDTGNL